MSVAVEEKMYPVSVAFEMLIGAKPASQTICRLVKTGQLTAWKVLGEWHCRVSDVRDHMELNTTRYLSGDPTAKPRGRPRSESRRERDIAAANAELEAAGIK